MAWWLCYFICIPLLPWVLLRGRRLRETIPDLPEAPGDRAGVFGDGPVETTIVSLGESPIAGVGLHDQQENLLPQLARRLTEVEGAQVRWQILGQTGIRIDALLPRFESELPDSADLVIVSIGVNDCKEGTSMLRWRRLVRATLGALRRRYPSATLLWSAVPPLRSFPALPWSVRTFLGARADLMNHLSRLEVGRVSSIHFFDLPPRLSADEFASDGFHPNAAAHLRWAEAIMDRLALVGPDWSSSQWASDEELSDDELMIRRPVWFALSEFFLDTEIRDRVPNAALACLNSGLDEATLRRIWQTEVLPVLGANLLSVAGVWDGFDQEWLERRICDRAKTRGGITLALRRLNPVVMAAQHLSSDLWGEVLRVRDWLESLPAELRAPMAAELGRQLNAARDMNVFSPASELSPALQNRVWADATERCLTVLWIDGEDLPLQDVLRKSRASLAPL